MNKIKKKWLKLFLIFTNTYNFNPSREVPNEYGPLPHIGKNMLHSEFQEKEDNIRDIIILADSVSTNRKGQSLIHLC